MFDLNSFIRQLLPPNRRTALNTAFIKLLFVPLHTLLVAIENTRAKQLLQARSTGRVLVLEELLNRAAFGSAIGNIYILDSSYTNVDFQVVVPAGLPLAVTGALRGILDTYKQSGKRYGIVEDASYGSSGDGSLVFESGYPYLNTNQIVFAIKQTGAYRTILKQDNTVVFDQTVNFVSGAPVVLDANGVSSFNLTIRNLSTTLTRQSIGVISGVTYQRSGSSVIALVSVDKGDVEIKLVGRNSTVYSDTFSDASVFDTVVSSVSYNRRRVFPTVSNGDYTLQFRVKGQTAITSIDFTLSTANQPPVVVNPMPDQTGKVGVYFTYPIPGNVFADPDGYIANYLTTGLPTGVTHSPGNPIAGTPTVSGTFTVRVTVTDNGGLTVFDEFTLTILPADSPVDPNPPTPPSSGSTFIIRTNTDVMYLVAENNGSKWRVRDTLGRSIPGGQQGYWYLNGQSHVSALSTDYEYDPGDELTVFYVIATSDDVSSSEWNTKAYSKIVFGTI